MATLNAYYQVDFKAFNLNFYRDHFESHEIVENSTDPTNAGSDDRYTVWTDDNDAWAIAFHGHDFAYGGKQLATVGTVEAFSEWFYNTTPDHDAGEDFGATRIYLLRGIDIALEDFYDAIWTNKTSDDKKLLKIALADDDTMKLSGEDDRVYGYGGDDTINGKQGNDIILGGSGNDSLKGGKGDDTLRGGSGADTLKGNKGDDDLKAHRGADVLEGNGGDDKLRGDQGADTVTGGSGLDKVWGGDGDDTFVFATGSDIDVVKDYAAGDIIDISGLASVVDWTDLNASHMTQVDGDVVIDGGNGDVLTLKGTDMASLSETDFIFQEPILA